MSREDSGGGISLKTLAVASVASALSAYVVQSIWRPGTLVAAAVTPIIVALVTEALNRPTAHVSRAGVLVTRAGRRVTKTGQGVIVRRGRGGAGEPTEELQVADPEVRRRRIRLATITGLIGFALVGGAWTSAELIKGESLFGGERRTTYFGGKPAADKPDEREDATPAATAQPDEPDAATTPGPEDDETPTPSATPSATPTPTATPEATPTPAPTAGGVPAPPAATP